ncbi:hypothetical protein Btru_064367 [Bulinus truncatus]|nr:hypothetical protein Btru_064367 [Bulinus truncatus]
MDQIIKNPNKQLNRPSLTNYYNDFNIQNQQQFMPNLGQPDMFYGGQGVQLFIYHQLYLDCRGEMLVGSEPDPRKLCPKTNMQWYKQCYGPYCWCVNANGTYLNGLTDQGSDLVCTVNGAEKLLSLGNCTNNQWPHISCIAACKDKVCPNNPNASCVVDLCSASCETKFIDVQGNSVTCGDDQCKPFSFNESVQVKCASVNPCPNAKPCPQSICKKALEQNCRSPCANCLLDPCTCQPYFVDVKTNQNLTKEQCKYLAHGACALQECKVKKDAVLAQLNDFDLENNVDHPPQCTEKGKFLPRQCRGESCQCINAFGQLANETVGVNGTCPAIDEIKKINTTLTFDASFDNVSKENRLQEFKEKCIAMLTEFGIDNQTIKYVSDPYKGSVKINITLESDPNSAITDMSVVYDVMVQGLDYFIIVLGNNTISLIIEDTSVSAQTASQEVVTEDKKESSGLSERDKIIIGCVVGIGGGLILITIIVLCVCCYCKKNRKSQSSAYDPIGAADNPGYDKTPARMNQAYEVDEDERYIKVKL